MKNISKTTVGLILFATIVALGVTSAAISQGPAPAGERGKTQTPHPPSPTPTPSQTAVISPTANPPRNPTATPTATSTIVLTPTVAPSETPSPEDNWIFNGRFDHGLPPDATDKNSKGTVEGWTQVNGYWWDGELTGLHGPLDERCPEGTTSGTWYLQMDRDFTGNDLWPTPPSEDWIYQIVAAPFPHDKLFVHFEEAHHLYEGEMTLTVYGRILSEDGIQENVLLYQVGVRSPIGTGKCGNNPPPAIYTEEIPIPPGGFEEYVVEVYGKMNAEEDGVLWGDFRLWGV